jgi:hypothetical protein
MGSSDRMTSFTLKSNSQWRDIWLDKLSRETERLTLTPELSRSHYVIVEKYLSENPGNPRTIECKKMLSFVAQQPNDVIPALIMFYETTAPSPIHCAALQKYKPRPPRAPATSKKPKKRIAALKKRSQRSKRT